jgi:hypothetical protein
MKELQLPVSRRVFVGRSSFGAAALLVMASSGSMTLTGCSAQQVFTDIEKWVPAGEQDVNAIVAILAANGFPLGAAAQATVSLIEAALNQLLADVKIYLSVSPPPVGALQKIQAALEVIASNYQQFLQTISIPTSPLLSTIVALAELTVSTIAGFLSQLPTTTGVSAAFLIVRVGNMQSTVAPKIRPLRVFKKDHNHILDAGMKAGLKVPDNAYLHLSLVERF